MRFSQASRMAAVAIAAVTIALPSAAAGKGHHPHARAVSELLRAPLPRRSTRLLRSVERPCGYAFARRRRRSGLTVQ
jgi:hypothetical protein